MKKLIFCIGFICLIAVASQAQNLGIKHGITAKAVFMEHITPLNEGFTYFNFDNFDITTSGAEIGYYRNINRYFNWGIPLRIGHAEIVNRSTGAIQDHFLSTLDGVIQLSIFDENYFFRPYLTGGIGFAYSDRSGDDSFYVQAPYGFGVNIRLTPNIYVQGQSEYRFSSKPNRESLTYSFGFLFLLGDPVEKAPPPPPDTDGDGITDAMDDCPAEPGPVDTKGCPDKDGDKIADKNDDCPDVAGLAAFSGCPDTDGDGLKDSDDDCPEQAGPKENNGCPFQDADGDGVLDKDDKCPNEAGPASNDGCPIKDADGDGVVDAEDRCPNEPGPASNNGCPVPPDSDGDGVIDAEDRCPNEAGPASNKGCPELTQEEKEVLTFAVKNIEFNTAKATLKTSSNQILDQIADILKNHPAYSCSISGHTDSIGSASSNQRLSERRAKACYDYLITRGISPQQMSYAGYGETQPIADNKYKEGRQANRRVEFSVFLR